MIRVSVFQSNDVRDVVAQSAQARDWPEDLDPHVVRMAAGGSAFTLRTCDRVLCVAGVVRVHDGAATAWAVMAPGCWGHMGEMTRKIRDYLDGLNYRRIDMLVRADFAAGHRWARHLGFAREALLRCWAPDGGDMVMHARIRGEDHG